MALGRALRVGISALLLLGVGCSPSSEEQETARQRELATAFAPAFKTATADYQQRMAEVQDRGRAALASGEDGAVVEVYRSLRDASEEAAEDFEGIEPPDAVVAQHRSLVENLRRQREALDEVIDAAGREANDDLTTSLNDLAELLVDFTTIHKAIDQELAQGP